MSAELARPATVGRNERLAIHGQPFDIPHPSPALCVASMTAHRGGCGLPEKRLAANRGLKLILTA